MPEDRSTDQPATAQTHGETSQPLASGDQPTEQALPQNEEARVQAAEGQPPEDQASPVGERAQTPGGQSSKERMAENQLDLLAKRLKTIDTFRLFSEAEIKAHLLPICAVRLFKAGEPIVKEGVVGSHAYFIISGHVKVMKRGVPVFQMQRRGDVFGEDAVIDGSPAPATIIAVKDTTCLALAARLVGSLKDESLGKFHSILYRVFAEKLVERLREADAIITRLKEEVVRLKKAGGPAAAPGSSPGG